MKKDKIQSRWERLKTFQNNGILVLIASFTFAFSIDRWVLLFVEPSLTLFLSSFLQIMVLSLMFLWMHNTSAEIQMLQDCLEKCIPPLPGFSFYLIMSLALVGGMLGYLSNNIIIFSAVFACYSLLNIWGLWVWTSNVEKALSEADLEGSAKDSQREAWAAIKVYYFERPQRQRCIAIISFSFIALIFSIVPHFLLDPYLYLGQVLLYGAYVIMILTIVISEVVIYVWRRERDKAIGETYT